MDFNGIHLIVSDNVSQFQKALKKITKRRKKYTDIEISEAYESLGIAQFYHGDYKEALINLELCIDPNYLEEKIERSVVFVKILLSNLYCRFGQYEKAENLLANAVDVSCTDCTDLVPTIQSNWAIALMHVKKEKDAVLKAREALVSAAQILSKTSSEYLGHVRVLVSIYLKQSQFEQAERLISTSTFRTLRNLLLAGIKYATGHAKEACEMLTAEQKTVNSPDHQVERHHEFAELKESQRGEYCVDDEYSVTILNAMVAYNLSVLGDDKTTVGRDSHVSDAVVTMQRFVRNMQLRRADINKKAKEFAVRKAAAFALAKVDAEKRRKGIKVSPPPPAPIIPAASVTDEIHSEHQSKAPSVAPSVAQSVAKTVKSTRTEKGSGTTAKDSAPGGPSPKKKLKRKEGKQKPFIGPLDNPHDPYNFVNWDQHPRFMSHDTFFYPVATLSTLLAVRAENSLLTARFTKGLEVEAGLVPKELDNLDSLLRDMGEKFREAVALVGTYKADEEDTIAATAAADGVDSNGGVNMGEDDDDEDDDGEEENAGGLLLGAAETVEGGAITDTGTGTATSEAAAAATVPDDTPLPPPAIAVAITQPLDEATMMEADGSRDFPDLSVLKDSALNYRLMEGMKSGESSGCAATVEAATKLLQVGYNINISNTSGQIIPPSESTKGQNKGKKKGGKGKGKDSDGKGADTPYVYTANKFDSATLRSEIMVLAERFGRDEISTWIQWALSHSGGLSFGVLGQNVPNTKPVAGFNVEGKEVRDDDGNVVATAKPAAAATKARSHFLHEVRNRLVLIDGQLLPEFNSMGDSVYAPGKLESRVLVQFVLVRICAQLGLKQEVGTQLTALLGVCEALHERCQDNESATYLALCARHRYDYEEWCTSPLLADEALLGHLVMNMLPLAKKYHTLTAHLTDVTIRRDSLKKLITLHTEIGRIPQYAGGAKWPPVSMETFEAVPQNVVDANEANNLEWVQMYGRIRAQWYMRIMTALASPKYF